MNLKNLLPAAALIGACSLALAQAPKKAPATPAPAAAAAEGKTLKLGDDGGKSAAKGGGPILTREELRQCLDTEVTIRKRLEAHDASRAPLDAEKEKIAAEQQTVREQHAPIDDFKRQIDELNTRMKAYASAVESWNQRATSLPSEKIPPVQFERKRADLNRESEALQKTRQELEADKARLSGAGEEAVRNYNAKAAALESRVADWNQRNETWNAEGRQIESDRSAWIDSCSNRRYREDDEKAIRRGQ